MDAGLFDPEVIPRGPRRPLGTVHPAVAPKPNFPLFFFMVVAGGLGMGLVIGLPIVDGTLSELHLHGGVAMFIGSTTGMAGTYLAGLSDLTDSRA